MGTRGTSGVTRVALTLLALQVALLHMPRDAVALLHAPSHHWSSADAVSAAMSTIPREWSSPAAPIDPALLDKWPHIAADASDAPAWMNPKPKATPLWMMGSRAPPFPVPAHDGTGNQSEAATYASASAFPNRGASNRRSVAAAGAGAAARPGQKQTKQTNGPPCSPIGSAVRIAVNTAADIGLRGKYRPQQTVIMTIKKNIAFDTTLALGPRYSCTIFQADVLGNRTLALGADDRPVVSVVNTHNVAFIGLNFWIEAKENSPACKTVPEVGKGVMCPTVHVYKSYGVQLTKGYSFGRIDIFRSMHVLIDSMSVTGIGSYLRNPGAIRVGMSGIGPQLVKSNNVISNCEAFGVDVPIVLTNGAVGVSLVNNFVHDFISAGIRCGGTVWEQGECMLTYMARNLIYSTKTNQTGRGDAAGIHFFTKWYNPGNLVMCNTIWGGDMCYNLDMDTSGVGIFGGSCINTVQGIHINNGKHNTIRYVFVRGTTGSPGWTSCAWSTLNNCNTKSGQYWEYMRTKYYNTYVINKLWPWITTFCKSVKIKGRQCNPKVPGALTAAQTGKCSGLPTGNFLDVVGLETSAIAPSYTYCDRAPTAPALNTYFYLSYGAKDIKKLLFQNYTVANLQLRPGSPILKAKPNFKNCPGNKIGPQMVADSFYARKFNIPMPRFFTPMTRMRTKHIHDGPTNWP